MNLIGKKVEANWGAMHPTAEGVIYGQVGQRDVIIRWNDGSKYQMNLNDIHEFGYRSANGSPIGIFFEEVV